jgi:formiminotetrahydrofolate cyclodeaminase
MGLAVQVASSGNLNAISDAGSSAALAQAAFTSAGLNVRTNANALQDRSFATPLLQTLRDLETQAGQYAAQMRQVLVERGQIQF